MSRVCASRVGMACHLGVFVGCYIPPLRTFLRVEWCGCAFCSAWVAGCSAGTYRRLPAASCPCGRCACCTAERRPTAPAPASRAGQASAVPALFQGPRTVEASALKYMFMFRDQEELEASKRMRSGNTPGQVRARSGGSCRTLGCWGSRRLALGAADFCMLLVAHFVC